MGITYVGTVGFGSYEEAQKYARERGMLDAIQDPRVDVIDRESGIIVARNVPKHEADDMSRGSPSYTQSPPGAYTDESARSLSYSPDIRGGKPVTIEYDTQTGAAIPISDLSQAEIEKFRNIEKAIAERPQIAGIREPLRQQVSQQARGDFGQRRSNLTSSERLQQARQQSEAEKIAERASQFDTAGPMLMEFRKLPTEYQTPQTLKSIAEASKTRLEQTPISRQEYASDIFRRQGKQVQEIDDELIVISPETQRKSVINLQRYGEEVRADIPLSAEYREGFEGQLGTGKMPFYAKGTLGKMYAYERGVQAKIKEAWEGRKPPQSLKRELGLEGGYDTRNIREVSRLDSGSRDTTGNLVLVDVPQLRETPRKDYAGRFGGEFKKTAIGYITYPTKILAPSTYGYEQKGVSFLEGFGKRAKSYSQKVDKFFKEFYPKDIPSVFITTGFLASPAIIQKAGVAYAVGVPTLQAIKEPSPETFGRAAGAIGAVVALGTLPKAAKAAKGELESVVSRRRAVDRIVRETELPKVVPQKAGLQSTTTISPFIKRAEPIKGIERIQTGDFTIINAPRGLQATRSTTGADFKGIARAPEPAKAELTEKGGITFAELGIEEGGILKAEPKAKKSIKAFEYGNILVGEFGKRTSIQYNVRSPETLIKEMERSAVKGKYGTIQTLDLSRPITVSRIKGRASPEQLLTLEKEAGKVNVKYTVGGLLKRGLQGEYRYHKPSKTSFINIDIARFRPIYYKSGKKAGKLRGEKGRLATSEELQQTIAHELLHYKTPESIYKFEDIVADITGKEIPYRLQPTEMISFGGESYFGKRGFKVSQPPPTELILGQGTIRKEGALRFDYPRGYVKEGAREGRRIGKEGIGTGKNLPGIFKSKGDIIKTGLKAYEVSTMKMGSGIEYSYYEPRNIFTRKAIFLRKTPEGKVEAKYITRSGRIAGKATYPYMPAKLKFDRPKVEIKDYEPPLKLDVGIKEEGVGTPIFSAKAFERRGKYGIVAKQKRFEGGRDIEEVFVGEAATGITQLSRAGKQRETAYETKFDERLDKWVKEKIGEKEARADIELVYQPKLKKDIAILEANKRTSIRRADVGTGRTIRGTAGYAYEARRSGYKPLKSAAVYTGRLAKNIYSGLQGMGKRGSLIIGESQFEQMGRVKVEATKPRLKFGLPPKQPAVSFDQLESALRGQRQPRGKAIPLSFSQKMIQQNMFKQPSRETTRAFTIPYTKSFIDIKAYPKIMQPSREMTRTYIRPQIRERPLSRERTKGVTRLQEKTLTRALERTLQRTLQRARTRTPTQMRIRTSVPTPPKTPPPFLFKQERGYGKTKRKEKGYGYYYREFPARWLTLNRIKKNRRRKR